MAKLNDFELLDCRFLRGNNGTKHQNTLKK